MAQRKATKASSKNILGKTSPGLAPTTTTKTVEANSNKRNISPQQRDEIIRLLRQGEDLAPEWARILFPPEKLESELVYHGKQREEEIFADTFAVPLQTVRRFGKAKTDWDNKLVFGDNLQVMKSLVELKRSGNLCNADGTPGVRLIYIDPPFASRQEYHGSAGERAFTDKLAGAKYLEFLRKRLVLLKELLSEDGSIYVHLDWKRQSHIRVLMDEVFGESSFRNEIHWYYYNKMPDARKGIFPRATDSILFYVKNPRSDYAFNAPEEKRETPVRQLMRKKLNGRMVNVKDKKGNLVYQTRDHRTVDNVWRIPLIPPADKTESTGFPTQKPEKLLARIIETSSNKGDLVLDCFAGSGTTLAVAEKLGRRWIGIDCGKLSIYTVQKRILGLREGIGNDGAKHSAAPFTLYNAGLYDFSELRQLSWEAWRFFALQLFQCRDQPHRIGGIQLDGYLKSSSVLIFNHQKAPGVRIDEETIRSMHEALGSKIGSQMFIIAPALVFNFQQDYLVVDGVRYYALRIPYSIVHELHQREFTALKQPSDEMAVNDTVDAVGFDFIRVPELKYEIGARRKKGAREAFLRLKTFKSDAVLKSSAKQRENFQSLSMVLLDYDFGNTEVFQFDEVIYADALAKSGWEISLPINRLGQKLMAVFIDVFGNEAREVIQTSKFGTSKTGKTAKAKKAK